MEHDITLKFTQKGNSQNIEISGEKRRHIFLSTKEALHNIVKHSGAKNVKITIEISNDLKMTISDDGQGISDIQNDHGNGIKNMIHRMESIKGSLDIQNGHGVCLILNAPLAH